MTRIEARREDAWRWLAAREAESADLIITDPPYESMEKHRRRGTTTRLAQSKASSNRWFRVIRNEALPALMRALYRVGARNAHCYVMCDQETLFHLRPAAEAAGFKWWKAIVWDKVTIGMGYHYRARHELIAFMEKGKRRLNDLGVADVLTVPRVRGRYPAEKPLALMETLVRQSSEPGEHVIDPFFGSGAVLVAAARNARRASGCDDAEHAHVRLRERIEGREHEGGGSG